MANVHWKKAALQIILFNMICLEAEEISACQSRQRIKIVIAVCCKYLPACMP
jgi:hypothetical protein